MSKVCQVTGKSFQSGNNVSHANNKTRRRWQPNLQVCSFPSEVLGTMITLRLTPRGIRTVEHRGGIDSYLLNSKDSELSVDVKVLKRRLTRAQEKKIAKAA